VVAVLPLLGACAYFNGIYTAKESAGAADKLARRGRTGQAAGAYALAAEKAETVLARYPRSRWRPDALYLAGRGEALSGRCAPAEARLGEFLTLPKQQSSRRDRATLALGGCYVQLDRTTEARRLLQPLLRSRDREVASGAALWMARASIALGETDSAERYLAGLPPGAAQWELADASLERGQYSRAESLLVARARAGDFRESVTAALRTLWSAHRRDGVERIVAAYSTARTPASAKIALHLLDADLREEEPDDSVARAHLTRAQGMAVDTLSTREIAARLCRLQVADAPTSADANAVLARYSRTAGGSPIYRRLQDNLLLLGLLERQADFTGSALFLAGEVARDSLHAQRLAKSLFVRLANTYMNAQLSPKALLAAAALAPDSADHYRERARVTYPNSPYTVMLAGGDQSDNPSYRIAEENLRKRWADGVALLADTLSKLRPASAGTLGAVPDSAARGAAAAGATPSRGTTPGQPPLPPAGSGASPP
jgi:hypothetical protein